MTIRSAIPSDLDAVARMELLCFPPAEAASRASLSSRIAAFPESFLIAEEDGCVIGFLNGCVTDEEAIRDEMFASVDHHKPDGAYQAIFGVDVHPDHRRKGVAEQMLRAIIHRTKARGKKGLILTCKEHLVHYYAKFGFVSQGISASAHGGAVWYDMKLEF